MSSEKKNSVGGAVAVLLVSLRKKKQSFEENYENTIPTEEEIEHVSKVDANANDEIAKSVIVNLRLANYAISNSESIINKVSQAIDWSGTADTLPERLKKVFSSCIANEKKRPKILTELGISVRELDLIGNMVDSLKTKSALNIQAIDI